MSTRPSASSPLLPAIDDSGSPFDGSTVYALAVSRVGRREEHFCEVGGVREQVASATELALPRYRALPRDDGAGRPSRQHGDVGSYWTVPVLVPLSELTGLRAIIYNFGRLFRVRTARQKGIALPPIQIGVNRHGHMWLIDGNHRLTEARDSGQQDILARFTFGGT
jgi:hypothetical protein